MIWALLSYTLLEASVAWRVSVREDFRWIAPAGKFRYPLQFAVDVRNFLRNVELRADILERLGRLVIQ